MIDMIVSSVLLSMGMMMLPPIIISLPFKVLLFVMVDGWYLLVSSLMREFQLTKGGVQLSQQLVIHLGREVFITPC